MKGAIVQCILRGHRLPETPRPLITAGELISPHHDQDATGNLSLRMMAPTAASKTSLLEIVAGATLLLCHAFPQERPTGQSGTASAEGGESMDRGRPQFLPRKPSAPRPSYLPPVRRRFYQRQDGL